MLDCKDFTVVLSWMPQTENPKNSVWIWTDAKYNGRSIEGNYLISHWTQISLPCPMNNIPATAQHGLLLGSLDLKGSAAARSRNPPVRRCWTKGIKQDQRVSSHWEAADFVSKGCDSSWRNRGFQQRHSTPQRITEPLKGLSPRYSTSITTWEQNTHPELKSPCHVKSA